MPDEPIDPVRLLFWNVFLLKPRPIPGLPGLPAVGELAAPAVHERASAIGRRLRGRFDIAALSEAFEPDDRARIEAGWASPTLDVAVGPTRGRCGGARRDSPRAACAPWSTATR